MPLYLLRRLDRWAGIFFLCLFALPVRLAVRLFRTSAPPEKITFIKLKGGGSLIIALPALLGLRWKYPAAEFILVCAAEARIYAELTGVFDRFIIIDDRSILRLAVSGSQALYHAHAPSICVDLEPNSWLAALFTLLTCASQRLGLVRADHRLRGIAYTTEITFNPHAPVYFYYDQICQLLGAYPAHAENCREQITALLPASPAIIDRECIALAPFTSAYAPERMMPAATWTALIRRAYGAAPPALIILGSARNQAAAAGLALDLRTSWAGLEVLNLAGQCSLAQSAAAVMQCAAIWAVDSGLLHIARLLGVSSRSFWGPTLPSQRLRPIDGLREDVRTHAFICSPCVSIADIPPCGGHNLCMISMADEYPNRTPPWVQCHR